MQTIYRPGQWYLIVVPGALVALPPDVSSQAVARLWDRLPAEKTLSCVVDVLTSGDGGSFSSLPPFAAAVAEGKDVRIALRGGVAARVSGSGDDAQEFTGAEVTTWSERFVGGATRIEITVEETGVTSGLPVQSGVVRAAAVSAELEAADAEPIVAVLGPVPMIESAPAGASTAALGASPAPPLAFFGAGTAAAVAQVAEAASAERGAEDAVEPDAQPVVGDAVETVVEPEPEPEPEPESGLEPELELAVDDAVAVDDAIEADEADAAAELQHPAPDPADEEAAQVPSDEPVDDAVDGNTLIPSEAMSSAPNGVDDTVAPADVVDDTIAPEEIDEFEQLFAPTVHTAPVPLDASPQPPLPLPAEGDHDGATISAAEMRALRQQAPTGHDAPTQVIPVAPSGSGRIRVSTGQVVELDRTVIIGRRPRSQRASGENLPHLVAVESPQQDISRSHLEVRPDADTVVVIDLHTTNGSTLLRPGADPVRLHPGEQTLVLSGDVVDLGDGVTVAFEDLP